MLLLLFSKPDIVVVFVMYVEAYNCVSLINNYKLKQSPLSFGCRKVSSVLKVANLVEVWFLSNHFSSKAATTALTKLSEQIFDFTGSRNAELNVEVALDYDR